MGRSMGSGGGQHGGYKEERRGWRVFHLRGRQRGVEPPLVKLQGPETKRNGFGETGLGPRKTGKGGTRACQLIDEFYPWQRDWRGFSAESKGGHEGVRADRCKTEDGRMEEAHSKTHDDENNDDSTHNDNIDDNFDNNNDDNISRFLAHTSDSRGGGTGQYKKHRRRPTDSSSTTTTT